MYKKKSVTAKEKGNNGEEFILIVGQLKSVREMLLGQLQWQIEIPCDRE